MSEIGSEDALFIRFLKEGKANRLTCGEVYPLSAGSQYLDGTTEISRTTVFGDREPTVIQKEAYTRVLSAILDIERIVWLDNTRITGRSKDILSCKSLKAH